MALKKARVQLLDEDTGKPIEEVDILTSADSITFEDGENLQEKLNQRKLGASVTSAIFDVSIDDWQGETAPFTKNIDLSANEDLLNGEVLANAKQVTLTIPEDITAEQLAIVSACGFVLVSISESTITLKALNSVNTEAVSLKVVALW